MNISQKVIETTMEIRERAGALVNASLAQARVAATQAQQQLHRVRGSLSGLKAAGRDLNVLARRHVGRFVRENRDIARAAGKDLSALARDAYASLARETPVARKPRKTRTRRTAAAAKAG